MSKAKEFLGLGFSKETSEILGNLGLKPKLDGFRSTAAPMNVPYGNFITRLEYKGFTVFRGSKKQVAAFAKELEEMGEEAAEKYLKKLYEKAKKLKRIEEIYGNPKFIQPGGAKYRIYEVESFVDLETELAGKVRASKAGKYAGKSFDAIGVYNDATTIARWQAREAEHIEKFLQSIDKHFRKIAQPLSTVAPLDYVALDFKYMDAVGPNLKQKVMQHLSTFEYKNYVSKHLIKLNY